MVYSLNYRGFTGVSQPCWPVRGEGQKAHRLSAVLIDLQFRVAGKHVKVRVVMQNRRAGAYGNTWSNKDLSTVRWRMKLLELVALKVNMPGPTLCQKHLVMPRRRLDHRVLGNPE